MEAIVLTLWAFVGESRHSLGFFGVLGWFLGWQKMEKGMAGRTF